MLEEKIYYLWEKQTEFGHIGVRGVSVILKDGVEIAKTFHRHVIDPDSDITNEDAEVKAIAKTFWTKSVKDKFKVEKEKNKNK